MITFYLLTYYICSLKEHNERLIYQIIEEMRQIVII